MTSAVQNTFFNLGIAPMMLDVLDRLKFTVPTPIQIKAIPVGIEGKDLVGIAQTGTGKTLAFAVPMLQRLEQTGGKGLVLAPTRELALQIEETFRKIGHAFRTRTAVLIGGASMHRQIQALQKDPHVVVATPGRLLDHLQQKTIALNAVKVLVLDEADRMLDMGFAPQIEKILRTVPKDRQTMLFSATMPGNIMRLASTYMKLPIRIEIAPPGTTVEKISQELFVIKREDKPRLLKKILEQYHGPVLLFCRTKIGAMKITKTIRSFGHSAAEIHSNRSLSQRREAIEGFKSGKYRILAATDIAARGIDVRGIELVLNYDLPEDADNYVHRIGRTARAGLEGKAISFATPDQGRDVRDIERLIKNILPISKLPDLPAVNLARMPQQAQQDTGTIKYKFAHNRNPHNRGRNRFR
jgi:ATP-dependent RNA helicase RhlE